MKRILVILVLLSAVLAGCYNDSNVKRIEKINGKDIVILHDNAAQASYSDQKYENVPESVNPIGDGDMGFFADDRNLLIIRQAANETYDIIKLDLTGKQEEALLQDQPGKYFQISPDGQKLLYVQDPSTISFFDIPQIAGSQVDVRFFQPNDNLIYKQLRYMDKENIFLDYSAGWGDTANIVFSDRHGAVYIVNADSEKLKIYDIDSTYKTDIKLVSGKVLYMKRDVLRINELGLKKGNYPDGNFLCYSDRDEMSDPIVEPSESLNLINYRLSPNAEKIALYFENKNSEGALFIADVKDTLFSSNILYRNLIHVSNRRIGDFKWSRDSKKLAYSTEESAMGLYAVNDDGSENNLLVGDKNIGELDWNFEGNSIIGVDETSPDKNIIQINLKVKEASK